MKNRDLAKDYVLRCHHRLKALDTLYALKSWADVVREAQEVVELALKGLLRHSGIEVPRVHDVSDVLFAQRGAIAAAIHSELETLADISRRMRRDRELAFYGSEDLTPSEFYRRPDAERALREATHVVKTVEKVVGAKRKKRTS